MLSISVMKSIDRYDDLQQTHITQLVFVYKWQ